MDGGCYAEGIYVDRDADDVTRHVTLLALFKSNKMKAYYIVVVFAFDLW